MYFLTVNTYSFGGGSDFNKTLVWSFVGEPLTSPSAGVRVSAVAPVFWVLHPWEVSARTRGHEHGGDEHEPQERSGRDTVHVFPMLK